MTITTLDGVIAGMLPPEDFLKVGGTMEAAGVWHSLLYTTGRPGAGVKPAVTLSGIALTSYGGQIPFPKSGTTYLARLQTSASRAGTLMLYDRLWHNALIAPAVTTTQTINSAAFPERDRNFEASGENVMLALEVFTATTNAGAITNTTLNYTSSDGTGGSATIASFPATAVIGTFVPFQLVAGHTGVKSIQGITLGTTYAAGSLHLVAYRPLAKVEVNLANTGNSIDALTSGFVKMVSGTVPCLAWLPDAVTATTVQGQIVYTQG